MSASSRRVYRREHSPNLLPKPDDQWSPVPPSPTSSGLSAKFSLSADPATWGNSHLNQAEPDDALHNPDTKGGKFVDRGSSSGIMTSRGLANVGCLVILCLGLVSLFLGYPVVTFVEKKFFSHNTGGVFVNATGQVAAIGNFGLIDLDTPKDAYTFTSLHSGQQMDLVFSDEFNTDGRTFYPGDDPYWEAVDLHYWSTNNLEWYDPSAVTTRNGSLKITLSATPNHGLNYMGGLVTTWNKFCFTGGLVVGAATLPGTNNIHGLWPAFWTMGNLGRAGYGASLDGMWYTYDSCDVGTLENQTLNGLPELATTSGSNSEPYNGALSYQPGQRLSRCTCAGESHPGPIHADGTYVGRSAPEIDIFEAQISDLDTGSVGAVSQSGQWAPFNPQYDWFNVTGNWDITDPTISVLNTYTGGAYQQATSVVSLTNQKCYELLDNCFSVYGIEYKPGFDDAYITWISDNKPMWTIYSGGVAADPRVEIGPRPVPQEPMYILANLGMSTNFGKVDIEHLTFPTTLSIDYIRVYQYPDSINVGCDPEDFPTQAYINTYAEAYYNPNLTTWVNDYNQTIPKNSFAGEC